MLISILGAIFLLGLVIFFHELFHFIIAKLSDVKVLKFSIGFGPALWRKTLGETEYQVALFPLGGFVKMHGESPEDRDQDPRSYLNKPRWQKACIIVAGPVGNLLLPILALSAMFWTGVTELTPRIQRVEPMTLAAQKGLRAGDEIRFVDGESVRTWSEVEERLPAEGLMTLVVRRGPDDIGFPIPVDEFAHLSPYGYRPVLGIQAGSAAWAVGLISGDRVTRVNGAAVETWNEFEERLLSAEYPLQLDMEREGKPVQAVLQSAGDRAGIEAAELYIAQVMPDSPAEKSGLAPKDRILEISGAPIFRWAQLVEKIQAREGETVEIAVLRGTERITVPVEVASARIEEPTGDSKTVGRIGIQPLIDLAEPETILVHAGLIEGVRRGFAKTVEITYLHVRVLSNLIRGKVPLKNIGGPILIIKAASSSAQQGLSPYLMMLSFISVGLGIINLFPIPLLDGGQLMLLGVEAVRRKPLSLRSMEVVQHAGLFLLLSMMVFAFYNDIMRDRGAISAIFDRFLDYFRG